MIAESNHDGITEIVRMRYSAAVISSSLPSDRNALSLEIAPNVIKATPSVPLDAARKPSLSALVSFEVNERSGPTFVRSTMSSAKAFTFSSMAATSFTAASKIGATTVTALSTTLTRIDATFLKAFFTFLNSPKVFTPHSGRSQERGKRGLFRTVQCPQTG